MPECNMKTRFAQATTTMWLTTRIEEKKIQNHECQNDPDSASRRCRKQPAKQDNTKRSPSQTRNRNFNKLSKRGQLRGHSILVMVRSHTPPVVAGCGSLDSRSSSAILNFATYVVQNVFRTSTTGGLRCADAEEVFFASDKKLAIRNCRRRVRTLAEFVL
jgi:hypothetical protein